MKKSVSIQKNLNKIFTKDKCVFLAYDQGLEHGPTDFNDENVDPNYIIKIGKEGKYNALIFQKGIVEKYNKEIKKTKVPLIIKLNGKTSLRKDEPISKQLCTVEEAAKLGAVAVGYTIYFGSEYEADMLQEFENIEREAHARGMPVIVWAYPRGKGIEGKSERELMAYATRASLEIGADIVKIVYDGVLDDLKWAVKSAGRLKVVIAGGAKKEGEDFVKEIEEVIGAGAVGLAIGRNVWQSNEPIELSKKIKKAIWR